jgi:hypothetical protein
VELSGAPYGELLDLLRGQLARPVGLPRFHLADGTPQVRGVPVTEDLDDDPIGVALRLGVGREELEVGIALETKLAPRVEGGSEVGTCAWNSVFAHVSELLEIGQWFVWFRRVGGEHERERKRQLREQVGVGCGEVNRHGARCIVDLDPLP